MTAEQELKLLAAIARRMPLRARQVLTLRKVYGFSQQEISERLRLPLPTVQRHLADAACALSVGLGQPEGDQDKERITLWQLKQPQ